MDDLTRLPNIGSVLARELAEAGITTFEQLADLGSVEAVLKLKDENIHTCLNKLYAIEGAIQGVRWHALSRETRNRLKQTYLTALGK